jgi:hypothetical protein
MMTPATGDPPCGDSVKVELLMVLRFISSLNWITTLAVVLTPVAPFTGASMATVGGDTSVAAKSPPGPATISCSAVLGAVTSLQAPATAAASTNAVITRAWDRKRKLNLFIDIIYGVKSLAPLVYCPCFSHTMPCVGIVAPLMDPLIHTLVLCPLV